MRSIQELIRKNIYKYEKQNDKEGKLFDNNFNYFIV